MIIIKYSLYISSGEISLLWVGYSPMSQSVICFPLESSRSTSRCWGGDIELMH